MVSGLKKGTSSIPIIFATVCWQQFHVVRSLNARYFKNFGAICLFFCRINQQQKLSPLKYMIWRWALKILQLWLCQRNAVLYSNGTFMMQHMQKVYDIAHTWDWKVWPGLKDESRHIIFPIQHCIIDKRNQVFCDHFVEDFSLAEHFFEVVRLGKVKGCKDGWASPCNLGDAFFNILRWLFVQIGICI